MPPLLQTGFRPFFLLAAALAALAVPWWGGVLMGWSPPPGPLPALHWHAHEMVVGFGGAVLSGFLLTAGANWTGRTTATGLPLAALLLCWLSGRLVLMIDMGLPPWAVALPDALWLSGLALALGRAVVLSRSWRNLGFVPVLLAMAVGHGAIVLFPAHARWGWTLALDAVVVALVLVSGRVVPLFTRNKFRGELEIVRYTRVERAAVGFAATAMVLDLSVGDPWWAGLASVAAGGLVLLRGIGWRPSVAMRVPLLAVLHVGSALLGLGLVTKGLMSLGLLAGSGGLHVLTIGAFAMLCLGMMSRVSMGHTGRPLISPPLATAAYFLLGLVLALRLLAEVGPWRESVLGVAALVFGLAFSLFLAQFSGILMSPRADGKPG